MKTLSITDDEPVDVVSRVIRGDTVEYYFADDVEIISKALHVKIMERSKIINEIYEDKERALPVDKHTYYDLQASSIADVGHKGKSKSETKQAFKDAVIARSALQEKRDTLLEQINAATTIEEVEAITW